MAVNNNNNDNLGLSCGDFNVYSYTYFLRCNIGGILHNIIIIRIVYFELPIITIIAILLDNVLKLQK